MNKDQDLSLLLAGVAGDVENLDKLTPERLRGLSKSAAGVVERLRAETTSVFAERLVVGNLVPHVIGGKWTQQSSGPEIQVTNPATGDVIGHLKSADSHLIESAVTSAKHSLSAWRSSSERERSSCMHRLHKILSDRADELAKVITLENGKLHHEAVGEIRRGIECIETAAAFASLGGAHFSVTKDIAGNSARAPRGIVAGATPFNFPVMIPLWMAPAAIVCGNAFLLKPSEQTPVSAVLLAECFLEAGCPEGIFQVLQGDKTTMQTLVAHPDVKAIGFVGSTPVAQAIYLAGSALGKPVRALGGAKNPIILTPGVDPEWAAKAIVSSATDCAGQRCMAASLLIALEGTESIVDLVKGKIESLEPGIDFGPLISPSALERIEGYLDRVEAGGARLRVDGRLKRKSPGYYLGASFIDQASRAHEASCNEIFGPVLTCIRVKNLESAMDIENAIAYGNAASILTDSISAAKYFRSRASAGMLGVNIPVPVPSEPRGFGGTKLSNFGGGDLTGLAAFDFWTESIKTTNRAPGGERRGWTD